MLKKLSYLVTAVIAVSILVSAALPARAGGGGDDEKKKDIVAEVGELAPEFTAMDIKGKKFDLHHYLGKIVVLEWTNHQCPFVKKYYDEGHMQAIQKKATDDGVIWVSIVSSAKGRQGHTSDEEAAAIIEQQGAHPTYKIMDPSGEIGKLYQAKTTPHMYVIDKKGVLAYAGAIDDNPSPRTSAIEYATNYVSKALSDLAAGGAVRTPYTPPYGCRVKYAK